MLTQANNGLQRGGTWGSAILYTTCDPVPVCDGMLRSMDTIIADTLHISHAYLGHGFESRIVSEKFRPENMRFIQKLFLCCMHAFAVYVRGLTITFVVITRWLKDFIFFISHSELVFGSTQE